MKLSELGGTPEGAAPEQQKLKLSQVRKDTLTEAPQQASGLTGLWNYLAGSAESLKSAAKEIPQEAGRFAGDVAQSLLPGQGGAAAGGRVLGKLGDVAAFTTGGLTGPGGMPRPPNPAGLARGLDVQPRAAQVPTPQLALPPPKMGVPGQPPTGVPGPLGRPLLLDRPMPPVGAMPNRGLLPQGPPSTMTAPSATPTVSLAETWDNLKKGETPKPPTPAPPIVPPDAHMPAPSPLANAIATNSDADVTAKFRKAVRTGAPGRKSDSGLTAQDRQITTAVDSIIEAKDRIQFRDPADKSGEKLLSPGRLPRTLSQFSQSIDHLKDQIFEAYDGLAARAGGQAARVPLAPVINRLQQFMASPDVRDIEPGVAAAARQQIERFQQVGSYSPREAQKVVSSLNAALEREIKNPTREVSHNAMSGVVLTSLRDALNETMNTALQGPQYQMLKLKFGALSSIEGDVANAVRKQLGQGPGLFDKLTNLGTWAGAAGSLAFHDLRSVAAGLGVRGAKELYTYMHSPNRAISQMFKTRSSDLAPSVTDRISANVATRMGEIRQRSFDRDMRDRHVSPVGP